MATAPGPDGGERPGSLLVVVGTATEVGKTWVSAMLVRILRQRKVAAVARKPVQSFDPGGPPTDAEVLAAEAGEEPFRVCPEHRWYRVAMAPPMAAQVLGLPAFTIAELVAELRWPAGTEVGIVETAGGLRSPQASDGDAGDLCRALAPADALLVADAGLGAISSVRLCVESLGAVPVLLNRYERSRELHRLNAEWLRGTYGVDVLTSPQEAVERLW